MKVKSVIVLADMSASFLVDITRPSRDMSYPHSVQCVVLIQGMFRKPSLLFSLHSVLRTIMSAEAHKSGQSTTFRYSWSSMYWCCLGSY